MTDDTVNKLGAMKTGNLLHGQKRRYRGLRPFLALALISLAVRVPFVVLFDRSPLGRYVYLDMEHYDTMAMKIAEGEIVGDKPFFVEPLYSYILGTIYAVFGHDLLLPRLFHALAGMVAVLLVYDTARRVFGARAGFGAGLAMSFYGPLVFYDAMILKTSFEVFAGVVFVWMLVRAGPVSRLSYWFAVGVVLGTAILLKGNYLLMIPLACVYGAFVAMRRRYLVVLACLAGVGLLVCPVVIRNSIFAGELASITTSAGMNFYQGNRPGAKGGVDSPDFIRPRPEAEQVDSIREAERRAGKRLTDVQASSFWFGEAWKFIKSSPGAWTRLMVRKIMLVWNHYEAADNLNMEYTRNVVPYLWVPFLGFWLIAPFGLAGMIYGMRGPVASVVLAVFAAVWLFSVAVFHVADRYRLAAVPALIILGAGFVVSMTGFVSRRRLRPAVGGLLLLCAACVAVHARNFYPGGQDMAPFDRIMGYGYDQEGKPDLAVHYMRKAAAGHYAVGLECLRNKRFGTAEVRFLDALSAQADLPGASYHLGIALEQQGKQDGALIAYQRAYDAGSFRLESLLHIGMIHLAKLEFDRAETAILRAMELAPSRFEPLIAMGELRSGQGRFLESVEAFEKAQKLKPDATGAKWLATRIGTLKSMLQKP